MQKKIVKVVTKGKLEFPTEFEDYFQPLTEYEIVITTEGILLKQIPQPLTWEELKKRQDELGSDSNQMTLEEISDIVKDVRQELWENHGSSS